MKIEIKDGNLEQLQKLQKTLNDFQLWCEVKYDTQIAKIMCDEIEEKQMESEIKSICSTLCKNVNEKINKLQNPNRKIWICIEATWSGYSSKQARVVHKEYRQIKKKDFKTFVDKAVSPHVFDDNTCNYYRVFEVEKKQKDECRG